jgi:hypothetical protein
MFHQSPFALIDGLAESAAVSLDEGLGDEAHADSDFGPPARSAWDHQRTARRRWF